MPLVREAKPSRLARRACSTSSWKRRCMSSPRGNCPRIMSPNWISAIDRSPSLSLELHVLVGRGEAEGRDEAEPGLLHAWAHAVDEGEVPDGNEHHPLVDELLHAMQDGLALGAILLGG